MKTIEILSGDQKVQFTTKSATFDNKEFLYAHMTQVVNDAENCTYTFIYEGETIVLPYLQKDEKVLNAIFSQVQKMDAMKKKAEVKAAPVANEETVADDAAVTTEESTGAEESTESKETAEAEENNEAEETAITEDVPAEETAEVEEKPVEEAAAEKKVKEKTPVDPEKQARHKKSLKVFGIVIAIILVLSVAYYFIFGTSNAPTGNSPGNAESQQYDDIDQLIEDLQ